MCDVTKQEMPDSVLVERMRGGDTYAFDLLFERHRRGVLAYIFGITGRRETAEELTQDCFLRFLKKLDSIDACRNVSGWLYRTARNLAIDASRRSKFEVLPGDDALNNSYAGKDVDESTPYRNLEKKENKEKVGLLLSSLSSDDRDVLMLRFYSGLKFREIAEVLDKPLGTVLWQAKKSLEKLKNRLPKGGRGEDGNE